ncbi:hypothetical protein MHBO_003422 [Bonamia ostreae]|uniref:Uncharacterized protein n=1 Tax=Bonamia ostreae TaxID=126728 RepID=A0ABV2AQD0_9EUKA
MEEQDNEEEPILSNNEEIESGNAMSVDAFTKLTKKVNRCHGVQPQQSNITAISSADISLHLHCGTLDRVGSCYTLQILFCNS